MTALLTEDGTYLDTIARSLPTYWTGDPRTREQMLYENCDAVPGYWDATMARIKAETSADAIIARQMNEGLPRDPFVTHG